MSSAISLRARTIVTGDAQSEYDLATQETVMRYTTVVLDDDFIGPGHSSIPANGSPATGYSWVQKTVKTSGSPTAAIVANSPGGIVQLAIDATSEKQEATLYANDQLNWDMTKSAIFEARVAFSVLPSIAPVEMVFGLQSAWIDGPDNAAYYARFQANVGSAINIQTKDGVQTLSNASGVTLVAGAFHIFRIDAMDPTNVRFFIDGVEVSQAHQMSFAATGAAAVLQPYFSVYKASSASLGSMQIDMVQIGMNRS